jgi:asparagine synthase (glutamine-hydrolysing)
MCGVAGIFHYGDPGRGVDERLLLAMTRSLRHRGPDDEGLYVNGPLGLGHRRLSIVDLSPTGRQPMSSPAGSWISYNGEAYTHKELRPGLEARGYSFRGTSDTETLLYALESHGPRILEAVAGIFGFAFWDGPNRRLILARDPLGVKQLYYHDDGRRIVFASEIKALLLDPAVPREPDPEAVNQYLHFHTPLFERTFFRGIRQVRAGEYLEVDGLGARARTYWQPDGFESRGGGAEENVEALRVEIERIVGEQLMSDVPVGAFFSAGIDSSAVAAFAKRAGHRLRCFGIHFSDQGVVDERPYQEAAAAALGLDLELTTLDGSTFPSDMAELSYYQDSPVVGAALLPMHAVSRLASRKVKVCMGGQAADEIFAGYARYALVEPGLVLRSFLSRGRAAPGEPGQPAAGAVRSNLLKQLLDTRNLRRLGQRAFDLADWKRRYFSHFAKVPASDWRALFSAPEFFSREQAFAVFDQTVERSPAPDPGHKALHWDMQTYLTGLFQQDDRMSMANSLESRVPLADPRLVRFAFHTAFDLKLRGGATKWILRQAVAPALPEMVLNRRKIGFDTPAERWMRGPHADFVRETLLSSRARARGFWSARSIETLLGRTDQPLWFDRVWKILSIELWASVFLDRHLPANVSDSAAA